jgi:hypothetical protein
MSDNTSPVEEKILQEPTKTKEGFPSNLLWPFFVAVAVLFIMVAIIVKCTYPKIPISEGTEYKILSYAKSPQDLKVKIGEKQTVNVPTYTITFTYTRTVGEECDVRVVPRQYLVKDSELAINHIVWDKPYKINGLEYRTVRWNPRFVDPLDDDKASSGAEMLDVDKMTNLKNSFR